MNNFNYTFGAAIHNHGLIEKAEKLINNFIGEDDGVVFLQQPDGTCVKIQRGAKLISISGITIEEDIDDNKTL